MSSEHLTRRMLFGLGAAGLIAATAVTAPPAALARPMDGNCKTNIFNMVCDQPVRADGSWMRCWTTYPSWGGSGPFIPQTTMCKEVGPGDPGPIPVGAPPYHLDADEGM